MTNEPYNSLTDLQTIVSDAIPEGVTLEYKSSKILADRESSVICKAITAFANSAGGHLIIGIDSKNGKPVTLDGGLAGPSKTDWIHKIVNATTYPPVENVRVSEIADVAGIYYVIAVAVSAYAPHQSDDRKYYKRRGSHSEPMEHYEIEDVRNRPKRFVLPLRIALFTRDQVAMLHLTNESADTDITDVRCKIDANFDLNRDAIKALTSRGLRNLRPQVQRYFVLDAVSMMLQANSEAKIQVEVAYHYGGQEIKDSASFFMADFYDSIIVEGAAVDALKLVADKVDKLNGTVEKISRDMHRVTQITDGSGLRLSQRTLRSMQGLDDRFDPYEFDWDGYKIILGLSNEDALSLTHIFGVIDTAENRRRRYQALPQPLRDKFEQHFKVRFE